MHGPNGPPVCNFWVRFGNCKFGDNCKFDHPTPEEAGGYVAGSGRDTFEQQAGRGRGFPGARGPLPPRLPPRPSEPAYLTRKWWTAGAIAPAGPRFRVMTYNVLADELAHTHRWELYRGTSTEMLLWPRRWALIKAELEHFSPDIVCLQEVDHWDDIHGDMAALGFQGTYAQRSGGRTDGCATFWRSACFEQVACSQLKFSDFDLRDNVGLLVLLCHKQPDDEQGQQVSRYEQRRQQRLLEQQRKRRKQERERQWQQLRRQQNKGQQGESSSEQSSSSGDDDGESPRARRTGDFAGGGGGGGAYSGSYIAVANTHILFNPKRGDVKIAQLRLLVKHLQALVSATLPPEQVQHVGALIMGDMNHQPGTPIYNFMRQGWVDCLQQHRKVMAGTHEELCRNPLARRQQRQPQGRQAWMLGRGSGSFQQQQQQQQYGMGQQQYATGQQQQYGTYDWPAYSRTDNPGGYMQQQQYDMPMHPSHDSLGMVPPPSQQQQFPQPGFGQHMMPSQQYAAGQPALQQQGMQQDVPMDMQQHTQPCMEVGPACGMHRSASAPTLITLRKVKDAGWSAEELVTATGGVAGTHLRHYLELEQKELGKQQKQKPQQQQLTHHPSAPALTSSSAAGTMGYVGGPVPPTWQQQQGMHIQGAPAYNAMPDLGTGFSVSGMEVVGCGEEMDVEVHGDEQRQRLLLQQGSGAREVSPETRRLKEQHQKAIKAQMKQHARAREALMFNRASRGALENLQLQQKKEASALKKQHQQQLLQRQFDKAAQQLRLQQQLQGLQNAVQPDRQNHDDGATAPPPPPPPAQEQQQQEQQQDASVPLSPPQQQQQDIPPPPLLAPEQQQEQLQDDLEQALSSPNGPLFTLQHSKYWPKHRWNEPLPAAVGDGIARHGLQLCSCYAELTGSEPEFTSCHDSFYGTVDYIWYTPVAGRQQLQPVAVLLPPAVEEHLLWMPRPCLPNASIPSDHISLVCDLELRQADDGAVHDGQYRPYSAPPSGHNRQA